MSQPPFFCHHTSCDSCNDISSSCAVQQSATNHTALPLSIATNTSAKPGFDPVPLGTPLRAGISLLLQNSPQSFRDFQQHSLNCNRSSFSSSSSLSTSHSSSPSNSSHSHTSSSFPSSISSLPPTATQPPITTSTTHHQQHCLEQQQQQLHPQLHWQEHQPQLLSSTLIAGTIPPLPPSPFVTSSATMAGNLYRKHSINSNNNIINNPPHPPPLLREPYNLVTKDTPAPVQSPGSTSMSFSFQRGMDEQDEMNHPRPSWLGTDVNGRELLIGGSGGVARRVSEIGPTIIANSHGIIGGGGSSSSGNGSTAGSSSGTSFSHGSGIPGAGGSLANTTAFTSPRPTSLHLGHDLDRDPRSHGPHDSHSRYLHQGHRHRQHHNPYHAPAYVNSSAFTPPKVPGYEFSCGSQAGEMGLLMGTRLSDGLLVVGKMHQSRVALHHEFKILRKLQLTNGGYDPEASLPGHLGTPAQESSASTRPTTFAQNQGSSASFKNDSAPNSTDCRDEGRVTYEAGFVEHGEYMNRDVIDFVDIEGQDEKAVLIMKRLGPNILSHHQHRFSGLTDEANDPADLNHSARNLSNSPFPDVSTFLLFCLKASCLLEGLMSAKVAHLAISPVALHWTPQPGVPASPASTEDCEERHPLYRDIEMELNDIPVTHPFDTPSIPVAAPTATRPGGPTSEGAHSAYIGNVNFSELRIFDFGHSKILSHERARAPCNIVEWQVPGYLEYHLQYLAPEQTGRAESWMDHRTDMYALGATLFTLLTMHFPYPGQDSVHILQGVLSKELPHLQEFRPDMPPVIDAILRKMTQKQPKLRYQNVFGFKQDILRCLNQLHHTGTISDFELGTRDISFTFVLPNAIFGRKSEQQMIAAAIAQAAGAYQQSFNSANSIHNSNDRSRAFNDFTADENGHDLHQAAVEAVSTSDHYVFAEDIVSLQSQISTKIPLDSKNLLLFPRSFDDGKPVRPSTEVADPVVRAIFVSGPSGVGKTMMIRGLAPVARASGLFAAGVFDVCSSSPYSAILSCIQSVLQQLLTQHTEALASLVIAIRTAFEPNSGIGIICDLIPELKYFFRGTEIPESKDVPYSHSVSRFHSMILKLIRVIATHFFMTWLIDDLHFADESSVSLLATLVNANKRLPMVLILTHRDTVDCLIKVKEILRGKNDTSALGSFFSNQNGRRGNEGDVAANDENDPKDHLQHRRQPSANDKDSASRSKRRSVSSSMSPTMVAENAGQASRSPSVSSSSTASTSLASSSAVQGGNGVRFLMLRNPSLVAIQDFLVALLHRERDDVFPLAKVLQNLSWLSIRQVVLELYRTRVIYFDCKFRIWKWEPSQDKLAEVVRRMTGREFAFLKERFKKLDKDTKQILRCACVCGSIFLMTDLQRLIWAVKAIEEKGGPSALSNERGPTVLSNEALSSLLDDGMGPIPIPMSTDVDMNPIGHEPVPFRPKAPETFSEVLSRTTMQTDAAASDASVARFFASTKADAEAAEILGLSRDTPADTGSRNPNDTFDAELTESQLGYIASMSGLQTALQEGILVYTSQPNYLRFHHDITRIAAASLMEGQNEVERLQFEMARILITQRGQEMKTASHLLKCMRLVKEMMNDPNLANEPPVSRRQSEDTDMNDRKDVQSSSWNRMEVSAIRAIFSIAGEKSQKSGAQDMAMSYWNAALSLLPEDCWNAPPGHRSSSSSATFSISLSSAASIRTPSAPLPGRVDQEEQHGGENMATPLLYDEALKLHLQAIEAERWRENYIEATRLCDLVLSKITDPVDRARIYIHQIQLSVWAYSKPEEGMRIAIVCLTELGLEPMNFYPDMVNVRKLYDDAHQLMMSHMSDFTGPDPRYCRDRNVAAIMEILSISAATMYYVSIPFLATTIALSVRLACKHGVTEDSSRCLVAFAITHSTWHGVLENVYELGRLAMKISPGNQHTRFLFYLTVQQWGEHVADSIPEIENTLSSPEMTCDRLFHTAGILHVTIMRVLLGRAHLRDCRVSTAELIARHLEFGPKSHGAEVMHGVLQLIKCLKGSTRANNPETIFDDIESPMAGNSGFGGGFLSSSISRKQTKRAMVHPNSTYVMLKIVGAFVYCHYAYIDQQTDAWHDDPNSIMNYEGSWIAHTIFTVIGLSLTMLLKTEQNATTRERHLSRLKVIRETMKAHAVKSAVNHAGMYYLLEAETSDREGASLKDTLLLYEKAIKYSTDGEFPMHTSFSYELAGKCHLRHGLVSSGNSFLNSAWESYQAWGAYGKVQHIQNEFPELFAKEQHQQQQGFRRFFSARDTVASAAAAAGTAGAHQSRGLLYHRQSYPTPQAPSYNSGSNDADVAPSPLKYLATMSTSAAAAAAPPSMGLSSPAPHHVSLLMHTPDSCTSTSAAAAMVTLASRPGSSVASSISPTMGALSTTSSSPSCVLYSSYNSGSNIGALHNTAIPAGTGLPQSPEIENADLDVLDFSSVIEAMQVIASEIDLDLLLLKSLGVLNQSVGAKFCCVIIAKDQDLVLAATQRNMGPCEAVSPPLQPFQTSSSLFHSVINYVINTSLPILLNSAKDDPRFCADEYLRQKPDLKTVLCAPILHKAAMVGVLYMEEFPSRAFANKRMLVMNLLVQQLGISITNALLYQSVLQSESKLNGLLENMPCGIALWDATASNCQYINTGWKDMTGFQTKDILDSNWAILVHPDEVTNYKQYWDERVTAGIACQWETRYRLVTDDFRWAIVRMLPIKSSLDPSKILQWLTVTVDIDDQRRAVQLKSNFLANMSHELRTPFSGILGMLSLLKDSSGLSHEQFEFVDMAKTSCEMLIRIVDDLLNFSKLEADKVTLEDLPFCFEEILGDVCDLLVPLASRKGLELIILMDETLPLLLIGDPDRMKQILMNLIGNAIKFSTKGNVVIRFWRVYPDKEMVATTNDTATVTEILDDPASAIRQPAHAPDRTTVVSMPSAVIGRSKEGELPSTAGINKSIPQMIATQPSVAPSLQHYTGSNSVKPISSSSSSALDDNQLSSSSSSSSYKPVRKSKCNYRPKPTPNPRTNSPGLYDDIFLRCSVADQGIGLSPEEQKLLFVSFQQADNGTTRKYGGTGLGLSICSQLISHMHGTIKVDSQKGEGSTFTFTVKLRSLMEEEYESREAIRLEECDAILQLRLAALEKKRVLLLTPNKDLQEQIGHLLQLTHFKCFGSVGEAIEAGELSPRMINDIGDRASNANESTDDNTKSDTATNSNNSNDNVDDNNNTQPVLGSSLFTRNGVAETEGMHSQQAFANGAHVSEVEPYDFIFVDHVLDNSELDNMYPPPRIAYFLLLAPTTETLRWILPPAEKERANDDCTDEDEVYVKLAPDIGGRDRSALKTELEAANGRARTTEIVSPSTFVGGTNAFHLLPEERRKSDTSMLAAQSHHNNHHRGSVSSMSSNTSNSSSVITGSSATSLVASDSYSNKRSGTPLGSQSQLFKKRKRSVGSVNLSSGPLPLGSPGSIVNHSLTEEPEHIRADTQPSTAVVENQEQDSSTQPLYQVCRMIKPVRRMKILQIMYNALMTQQSLSGSDLAQGVGAGLTKGEDGGHGYKNGSCESAMEIDNPGSVTPKESARKARLDLDLDMLRDIGHNSYSNIETLSSTAGAHKLNSGNNGHYRNSSSLSGSSPPKVSPRSSLSPTSSPSKGKSPLSPLTTTRGATTLQNLPPKPLSSPPLKSDPQHQRQLSQALPPQQQQQQQQQQKRATHNEALRLVLTDAEQANCKGKNVLVAEDDFVSQKILEKQLTKLGMNVTIANNGQEAIDRWLQAEIGYYTIAIFDHHMPIMDGLAATRKIRALEMEMEQHQKQQQQQQKASLMASPPTLTIVDVDGSTGSEQLHHQRQQQDLMLDGGQQLETMPATIPRIPIVGLSADIQQSTRESCIKAGMDEYLTKPLLTKGLALLIRRYCC